MTSAAGDHDEGDRTAAVATGGPHSSPAAADGARDRRRVLAAEKDRFGGMRFFTAFFGWLTATGTVVLLSALVTGIGAAAGLGDMLGTTPTGDDAQAAGIVGSIVLAVVIFIGYLAGGYVAGRMARFSGLKQGLAVWLWLILVTVVVAIIGAVVSSNLDLFAQLGSIPDLGNLTGAGAVAAVAAAIVALIGALLGGLAGMRYHRRVDRAGLDA